MERPATTTILALVAALAATGTFMVHAIRELREGGHHNKIAGVRKILVARWRDLVIIGLILLVAWILFRTQLPGTLPPNAALTRSAWNAYNTDLFDLAMNRAGECIAKFLGDANSEQARLEAANTRILEGVVSDKERETILSRGLLNDVATAYYIRALASERMDNQPMAIQAYEAATKFTHALVWDPSRNMFWSPARAAGNRLSQLGKSIGTSTKAVKEQ